MIGIGDGSYSRGRNRWEFLLIYVHGPRGLQVLARPLAYPEPNREQRKPHNQSHTGSYAGPAPEAPNSRVLGYNR